jgi:glutamyl-tRNA(Gln) amidotransferase subunit E
MDYSALGLKVGLEIHQQLDTHKLFCQCASGLSDGKAGEFTRTLRPTQSEMGEVDSAALSEAKKNLRFRYQAPDTICLVEADEEPPHEANETAVDAALEFAAMVDAKPVDEVQFMRKIVIDGSNTTGFQRTALIALDGSMKLLETDGEVPDAIGISTISLEEDAARRIGRTTEEVTYRLDRLGIPLIEVATEPDMKSPAQAKDVAERIGSLMRATKKVKRGIGTIREDLNVSISDGARVEIKGIQELRMIDNYVENEVVRQLGLVAAKKELERREVTRDDLAETADVTGILKNSASKIIQDKIEKDGIVLGIRLRGFDGLLGDGFLKTLNILPKESYVKPERLRILGPELADYVKTIGVRGLFHSDELPAYGITGEEVSALKKALNVEEQDAFVLIAVEKEKAEQAGEIVIARAHTALEGVPKETRDPLPDGSSSYSRPLPGKARMYPETDVPPIRITQERLDILRDSLPEMPEHRLARFTEDYELNVEQASQLMSTGRDELFETLINRHQSESIQNIAAKLLLNTLPELEAEGIHFEGVGQDMLDDILGAVSAGQFAKEGIPQVMRCMIEKGISVEQAVPELGLESMDGNEVEGIIDTIISEKIDFVRAKGLDAVGPLMGAVMKELRGKVDGKVVNEVLKRKISEMIGSNQ